LRFALFHCARVKKRAIHLWMEQEGMTKSELIEALAAGEGHLAYKDVELAVRCILDKMSHALATGERIEIRGFGSFSLHYRPPRIGRNPKTGEAVALAGKHVPHFKPGKELRDRVNASFDDGSSTEMPAAAAAARRA
jgi:integration host factor subunit beta